MNNKNSHQCNNLLFSQCIFIQVGFDFMSMEQSTDYLVVSFFTIKNTLTFVHTGFEEARVFVSEPVTCANKVVCHLIQVPRDVLFQILKKTAIQTMFSSQIW